MPSRSADECERTQGDVLVVAQLAGIQAAKLTSQLIPLCHALSLRCVCPLHARLALTSATQLGGCKPQPGPAARGCKHPSSGTDDWHNGRRDGGTHGCACVCIPGHAPLRSATAAAVAGLTVYDMVKAVTKEARLSDVQLEHKDGGRTGSWTRIAS